MKARFVWKLALEAAPDKLWHYVADTNRINQYAGLPEFTFRYVPETDGGSRQIGETRYMGWRLQWEEHPFEWIEGQYFKVIRSYQNGPIREFHTSVRLTPQAKERFLNKQSKRNRDGSSHCRRYGGKSGSPRNADSLPPIAKSTCF